MDSSRRRVLQLLGLSSLALTARPVLNAVAAGGGGDENPAPVIKPNDKALTAKQWAMVIDTRQFESVDDVEPLVEACDSIHNVPHFQNKRHEIKWIWEAHYHNAFPGKAARFMSEEVEHRPFVVLCNHCENPPCVRACPTKATFKRESDGIVLMDFHRCIGCRFCMAACPFGARSFNYRDPRPFIKEVNKKFPTRMKGVVEKCNFCAERLAEGRLPACVEASEGKLIFGDLYDPKSEVRELIRTNYTIRRKQVLGTEPAVYYIV
ncbi:MAG: 4Fe-4S dicluster domain-containing protein [Deltaproteobacteria bacterium]|jgi:molybdopterin-containing oxidoreductase family iron-sulfur binding subunit|nr:4Fe-4S dicluster domain-containing protein [Deltaproteobacteria bacterium]